MSKQKPDGTTHQQDPNVPEHIRQQWIVKVNKEFRDKVAKNKRGATSDQRRPEVRIPFVEEEEAGQLRRRFLAPDEASGEVTSNTPSAASEKVAAKLEERASVSKTSKGTQTTSSKDNENSGSSMSFTTGSKK